MQERYRVYREHKYVLSFLAEIVPVKWAKKTRTKAGFILQG